MRYIVAVLVILALGAVRGSSSRGVTAECVVNTLLGDGTWSGAMGAAGTPLYEATVRIDNKRAVTAPLLALAPDSEKAVVAAVNAVRECGTVVTTKSGGHGAAGYCLNDGGVVVNMHHAMHAVEWVDESAGVLYVEAGALWEKIYASVDGSGWLPIGGGCPQVGMGGFILGGGWSFLSRSYGLAIDNMLSVRYVVANGTAIEGSRDHNSNVLWAAKGGGGGNFGIATSFTIQLQKAIPDDGIMLIGELCWNPFDEVVLTLWQLWLEYYDLMPFWMDVVPVWLPIGPGNSRMFCFTVICNNDPDLCSGELTPFLNLNPVLNDVMPQPFIDWQLANVNVTDAQEGYLYLTSGILERGALDLDLVQELMVNLQNAPSARNLVLFHVGGGAIANVNPNATAFPHRHLQAVVQVKAIWEDPSAEEENVAWVNHMRELLLPHLSGSYVDYIDPNFPDWQHAYYGDNYKRLLHVQRELDPTQFFAFPQGIGQ